MLSFLQHSLLTVTFLNSGYFPHIFPRNMWIIIPGYSRYSTVAVSIPRPSLLPAQTARAEYPVFNVHAFCHFQARHVLPLYYIYRPMPFRNAFRAYAIIFTPSWWKTDHKSLSIILAEPDVTVVRDVRNAATDPVLQGPIGTEEF